MPALEGLPVPHTAAPALSRLPQSALPAAKSGGAPPLRLPHPPRRTPPRTTARQTLAPAAGRLQHPECVSLS